MTKRNKKSHEETAAVFRIDPVGSSNAVIKYKGYVTKDQKLGDEVEELGTVLHPEPQVFGKNAIPIKPIDSYEMVGRIYRSNIVGSYIVLESNYPVIYLTVEYYRAIVNGSLFQLYISIKMDDNLKKEISKEKQFKRYKNLTFNGTWNLSIDCDSELHEMWRDKVTEILKEEGIQKFHEDFAENQEKQNMSVEQTIAWVNSYVENEIKWYETIMTGTEFTFRSFSRTREYFIELCNDPRFYNLIKVAMDCRVIHRRKEQHIPDDELYTVPEKVVNLDEMRKQMIENNEIIESDSD